ncbi:16S rRNA (guanine(966)-N(2))-methyltransferase RsmD [Alysiella filiformis]|uniref:16S rRNA (Guanine(966)-N(2))-methyltransferase RsmD n=1 Tax=Alysiella filiformis DSM 16848 TaxID=1120981 RepID=A0A286EGN6_9NEIS|nr:16S rRNA (guanine(966)-N(2))-methyltransferase RsmD [Alysiella filiformis]QMT31810.1 16S rRNA (guanine(966)-N(2))-methyltransferase RsmD [Alysiella filiformis]UBQ57286.1 16S rRNA (guanine(966)-N(2))-methyltransferase RsmD [Alysiella filiformis DSM 16848]SOD70071.1 16S rRNA (guanine(966)-N(2))-methyltransferase RsmD [Alysiella filiformis DSM 16848]
MKPNPQKNKINAQHRNQIRIIGGELRGRKIHFPTTEGLRPTPDSVRERLFNWLGQDLTGQIALDLFAGSGALGFEALSRHAKHVYFCENNRLAAQSLRQHAQQFALQSRSHIAQQDSLLFLQNTTQTFDLVLLDPPFAWQNWAMLFQHLQSKLNPQAHIYLEAGSLPELPHWLTIIKQGKAGQSQQLLLQYANE